MNCIPVPADLAFRLLDELSRARALADDETDLLELIVSRGHQSRGIRVQWTPKLERALWRASHSKGAVRRFAQDQGITEMACYKRIAVLRERKARRVGKVTGAGGKG